MQSVNQQLAENEYATLPYATGLWMGFTCAPVMLQGFLLFASSITVLNVFAEIYSPLGEIVTPFVGWSGSGKLYSLIFLWMAVFTPQRKHVYTAVSLLGLAASFGACELACHIIKPQWVHAYLVYHDFRPVFTIVLPTFWILLLLSANVRRWIHSTISKKQSRVFQFSLADLLYLTFAVCLAKTSSTGLVELMQWTRESVTP